MQKRDCRLRKVTIPLSKYPFFYSVLVPKMNFEPEIHVFKMTNSFSNCVISINIYKHNWKSLNVEFNIFFRKYMTKHIFSKILRYFEFAYFKQNFKLSALIKFTIPTRAQSEMLWSCYFLIALSCLCWQRLDLRSVWARVGFAQAQHFLLPGHI